jgi:hypothetical protein
MPEEAAPPRRLKRFRRLMLVVSLVLVVAVVFAGLKIFAGYVLGFLAAVSFLVALTCHWRKVRYFLILLTVTVLGTIFISMIYVEVLLRIFGTAFGEAVFVTTGWKVFDVFVSNMIIFFTPAGMLVGLGGSLILYIHRLITGARKDDA